MSTTRATGAEQFLARGSRPLLAATVHPSAVLRDRNNRDQAYQLFVDDLRGLRTVI